MTYLGHIHSKLSCFPLGLQSHHSLVASLEITRQIPKVPFGSVVRNVLVEVSSLKITWKIPKSVSLQTKLSSSSMFAAFKSPCIIMLLGRVDWRKMRTEHNSVAIHILVRQGKSRSVVLTAKPIRKASANDSPRFWVCTNKSYHVWMPQFSQKINL